jgi:hypothetical protein
MVFTGGFVICVNFLTLMSTISTGRKSVHCLDLVSLDRLVDCAAIDYRFEWVVHGALEALKKAQETGELTMPRPKRALSPQHQRKSPTPPLPARARLSYSNKDASN